MKREGGDNVRGNRDGRGETNGGRRDRARPERRLLRALCPRGELEISSPGRSGQVRNHLHTLRTDGNGFGMGSMALIGAVVSIPPN